ncbi:ABC transporter substrate-binding protein [Rhodopila sp.]|uniref:ABC transporter substrate-binding protein n=1 Tax=Rhodopila sp. TaxID=2480087 RepID=UPI003D14E86E
MINRRSVLTGGAAAAASLASPALAANPRVLRYVPQANLANPDPIWTTATIATLHGYMVWDTLFGIDQGLVARPQMLAGSETSADGLTWKMTLRDGLLWHDNEPVLAKDCIPSIQRWGKRDGFGQRLMSLTAEMKVIDDKSFQIRLTRPFPQMAYALGANGCFIMPERLAKTDAFTQISEYVGSGPFKFLKDEWVSGASAAYAKNEKYQPRQEPPSYWSGGKVVNFDRVEWKIMPDPATAAEALQSGEVDWWENPLFDLLPMLKTAPGVTLEVLDPLGALGVIGVNHTQPPFDNPKLLQAILVAVNQQDYMDAVLGDQQSLGQTAGFFIDGSPMASNVDMDKITGKRNLPLAKKMVAESGYKGEPIVLMSPSDQPQLSAMAQVTDAFYKSIGLNSKYTSMDWGTLVSRRASHAPSDKGGWNSFCTTWGGLAVSNPGSNFPLRGNGNGGWFGWPTDAKMEALRDKWFDAPDIPGQQAVCRDMQRLAFQDLPFFPTGQWFTPTGHRDNLTGFVKAGVMLFWGVKRV